MNTKAILVTILLSIPSLLLHSQCNVPFEPVDVFEVDVPLFCDGIDGFCSQLPEAYTEQEFPGCSLPDFAIQNGQVISFVAGSDNLYLRIISPDCSFGLGTGMQAALYEEKNPFLEETEPIALHCGEGLAEIIELQSSNLKVGKLYYLVLDGWTGIECEYLMEVLEGSTKAPHLVSTPALLGPDTFCDGGTYEFSASADSTCNFIWNINGTIMGNHHQSFISVTIEDVESFTISVSSTNVCYTSEATVLIATKTDFIKLDSLVTDIFCAGTSYSLGSMSFSEAGVYSFSDTVQCEIIDFELNLTELVGSDTTIMEEICVGGCLLYNGKEYCEAGIFTDVYHGVNGCDSIVHFVVEHIEAPVGIENGEFCTGGSFFWNGVDYSKPGVYDFVVELPDGCDSIVNLILEQLDAPIGIENGEFCTGSSFFWNGVDYSEPGLYEFVVELSDGCDSIAQLQLEATPLLTSTTNRTICVGDSVEWNNEFYTMAGLYELEFTTSENCDSIAILRLSVATTQMGFDKAEICEGDVYNWNNMNYDEAGLYTSLLNSSNGCDSVVVLDLVILAADSIFMEVELCSGEVYLFDGLEYDSEIIVENQYMNLFGCDSIRILDLTYQSNPKMNIEAEICELDTFFYAGNFFIEAGSYQVALESINNCDTIVTLDLYIIDTFYNETTIGVESGEEYNGVVITSDTVFFEILTSVNGCDSTLVTNVMLLTNTEEENKTQSFNMFPNPASNYTTIVYKEVLSENINLRIIDLQGQLVYEEEFSKEQEIKLDLSSYATGAYFIIVEGENGILVEKLIRY